MIEIRDGVLMCPRCGHNYLHHGDVTINNRISEDQPGTPVTVEGGTGSGTARYFLAAGSGSAPHSWGSVSVRAASGPDFAGRRDDVQMAFMCESCGPVGTLLIKRHKGCTIIKWR